AFEREPDAGIVYGNAELIDAAGRVTAAIRSGPFDLDRQLNGINGIPQPAAFIRASVFEQIGYLDERLHYVMDYELWLRASRATELRWLDATLAQFRVHDASKTTSQWHGFWPESRRIARAYGGPYFSRGFRVRYLNVAFAKEV